jgi:hypothetical protein
MALRIIGLSCGCLLAAGLSIGAAEAGGRGGGFRAAAPHAAAAASAHRPAMHAFRSEFHRRHGPPGFHHGARHGRRWTGPGYAGPWFFPPQAGNGTIAVVERPAEPVDPDSFENLQVRAGIRRGPAPEPTIYRLEGPRLRPAARVIRIGAAEPQGGRRTRFAHAETGALLLIVPAR